MLVALLTLWLGLGLAALIGGVLGLYLIVIEIVIEFLTYD